MWTVSLRCPVQAPVAQWIEHWSSEPGVAGSNPAGRAISLPCAKHGVFHNSSVVLRLIDSLEGPIVVRKMIGHSGPERDANHPGTDVRSHYGSKLGLEQLGEFKFPRDHSRE